MNNSIAAIILTYNEENIKEMNIVKNNYMGGVKTKVLFS